MNTVNNVADKQLTPKTQVTSSPIVLSVGIAIVLVLLYASITIELAMSALRASGPIDVSQGVASVFTTIGGLISALAVAVLAATPPGDSPARTLLGSPFDINIVWKESVQFNTLTDDEKRRVILENQERIYDQREKWLDRTILFYLVTWVLCGVIALVVGIMIKPGVVSVLENTGTTWLGIAVAAVYAYLGIKPE